MGSTGQFGPYEPVRRTGNMYFVSGQVGVDPESKIAPNDAAAQTSQALMNLQAVLETVNLSLDNIMKTTVFLTDIADFTTMNEVYQGFFEGQRPARTTVAVKELPRLAKNKLVIEIEAIAVKE